MPYLGRGLEKGNYLKLDDISSQFDGSKTTFNLTVGGSAHVPGSSYSLLVSLSGIVQEGEAAYTLDQNEITFAAAPQAADDCFIISLGTPLGIGVPSNGTVNGTQLAKPLNYDNFFHLDHINDRVGIGTSLPTQSLDVYDGNIAIRDPATASQFLGFYHNRDVLKASIDKTGNNLTFENVDSGIIDYKIGGSSRVSIGSTGKIFFGTDDDTYFYRPGADTLGFLTGGTERLRITSDGRLLLNNTLSRSIANVTANVQLEGTTSNTSAVSITRNSDNAFPPRLNFGKSRGTVVGIGSTIVHDGDNLGEIRFSGADGDDLTNHAARISAEIDGNVGINSTPGRLIFSTTSVGGSDPTERLRITSTGLLRGTSGQHDGGLELLSGSNNQSTRIRLQAKKSDGTSHDWYLDSARSTDRFTIHDGTTSWFTILGTGNIGIGSVTPGRVLTIRNSEPRIRLQKPNQGHGEIYIDDDNSINLSADSSSSVGTSSIIFRTNGAENVRIKEDKVGIGTSTISYRLQVQSDGTSTTAGENVVARFQSFGSGRDATIQLSDNVAHSATISMLSSNLIFKQSGAETLRITSGGSVGIGTSNPYNMPLDVRGQLTGVASFSSLANGSQGADVSITHTKSGITDNDKVGQISFSGGALGNATTYAQIRAIATDISDKKGDIAFYTRNGNNTTGSLIDDERLRITSAGKAIFSEEIETPQDYPNVRPTLDFNFAATKKLDPRITYQRTGSASFVNEFGKIVLVGSNVPRFDHDPVTRESKGLLIEVSRTNYIPDSLNFSSAHWAFGINHINDADKIAVDNSVTNPDGSVGAHYRTSTDETYVNPPYCDLSGANTDTITVSLFVKERSGVSGSIDIEIFSQISPSPVSVGAFSFNPATATVSTADANFSDGRVQEFPNGWYRVSAKVTTNSGNFTSTTRMDIQSNNHYMWGPQIEEGSFPTSFIPTNGETSTRGTENIKIDGDDFTDFYNPIESTVACEFDSSNWITNNHTSYERIWSISDGSESEVFEMFKQHTANDSIRFRVRDGGANVLGAANISYGTNTTPKMAFALKLNDAAVAVDGTIAGTTDTGIPMPTVNQLTLGNHGLDSNANNRLSGHIRKFSYYPVKLPDSQVITLTS